MQTSRFWFESLQNWQSEFLAVLTIVVLSMCCRFFSVNTARPNRSRSTRREETGNELSLGPVCAKSELTPQGLP
jgi:hypothetical protein